MAAWLKDLKHRLLCSLVLSSSIRRIFKRGGGGRFRKFESNVDQTKNFSTSNQFVYLAKYRWKLYSNLVYFSAKIRWRPKQNKKRSSTRIEHFFPQIYTLSCTEIWALFCGKKKSLILAGKTALIFNFGLKNPSDFGEEVFFPSLEITCFWPEKPLKFSILARKSHGFRRRPFFFFGNHLIFTEKWSQSKSETIKI